jgi:hypothetical protein
MGLSDQSRTVIERARKAAQVAYGEFHYEEAPAADAAVRVVLEHLRAEFLREGDEYEECGSIEEAVAWREAASVLFQLLEELGDA